MKITVVIPCRNEFQYIEECVRAIFNSKLNENIQLKVYVIDGMSDDGTREIIEELSKQFHELFLIDNPEKITPVAFNIGVQIGDFDFLQRVDARHIISDDYIQTCLNALLENKEVWCAGGKLINSYTNVTSRIIADAMSTPFGMGLGNFRTLKLTGYTDTVTSPMYPKFVFKKIGYFDERLIRNQDDDFNFRVLKAGGKILFINEISIKYYVRTSISNLKRQFFQYGYWKVFVNRKHKSITTWRQLAPLSFVLFLLLTPFSLFKSTVFLFLFLPVILIYITLVLFFSSKLIKETSTLFSAIAVYPIMHIYYGVGYLKGIIHFLILNNNPSDNQKTLSR